MRKKAINFLQSWKDGVLGLQHLIGMFGATTLVPLLTDMDTAVALFAAGIGTL
jgi:uracil permease